MRKHYAEEFKKTAQNKCREMDQWLSASNPEIAKLLRTISRWPIWLFFHWIIILAWDWAYLVAGVVVTLAFYFWDMAVGQPISTDAVWEISFVCLVVAAFRAWFKEHHKLEIEYLKNTPKIAILPQPVTKQFPWTDALGRHGINSSRHYFFVVPKCLTETKITKCTATLIGYFKNDSQNLLRYPSLLRWSHGVDTDYGVTETSLERYTEKMINACYFNMQHPLRFLPDTELPCLTLDPNETYFPAKYRLCFKIVAEPHPAIYVSININCPTYEWYNASCEILSGNTLESVHPRLA